MNFYYMGIDKWGERRYYCKRERNNRFVTSSKAFPKIFLIFSVCGEEVFLYLLEWKLCFVRCIIRILWNWNSPVSAAAQRL